MSVSYIPDKVKFQLWAVSAGRCEYEGCNQVLWFDLITKAHFGTAYIAHIIADKSNGPRGDAILSEKHKSDSSNLMLLCDVHHRLIDISDIDGHPVERLRAMKRQHETRIRLQTSFGENRQSYVLQYGANIGQLGASISWKSSYEAMTPNWYPAEAQAIEIGLDNSSFQDATDDYWRFEQANLQMHFDHKVKPRLGRDIQHLSVFALAPQPLLIELGRLISDISPVEVYQHQREPYDNWKWDEENRSIDYQIIRPAGSASMVALNLSLSATVVNDRITATLGDDVAIWTITINEPSNVFLKSRAQLESFRCCFRRVLNEIKAHHVSKRCLYVFPAVPVSVAVEIGRVWMPKADLTLRIYDQNTKRNGFFHTLDICHD